jgi:uracil phosphoribosyltransferase
MQVQKIYQLVNFLLVIHTHHLPKLQGVRIQFIQSISASAKFEKVYFMTSPVTVIDHPLVLHKLSLMRDKTTPSAVFRKLLNEISLLLAYEVLRDLPLTTRTIETPIESMEAPFLAGKKLCLVSILRAGNGLLSGMMDLVPSARVGHIGLYRDPKTLKAVEYYLKLPDEIESRPVILVDPMLATGNSVSAAIDRLKQAGAKDIRFMCLLSAPEGIKALSAKHPDVPIFTAAIDSHLNDHGYIVPGLGDAGDRMFGTK